MASIDRTAYPRFSKQLGSAELMARYTPSVAECDLASRSTNGNSSRLSFIAMLKTRQQLGFFPSLRAIPEQIVFFLADTIGVSRNTSLLDSKTKKKTLFRYRAVIREHLGSIPYDDRAEGRVKSVVQNAALTMSDPADLINVSIETLIKNNIELPAYSNLDRLICHLRHHIHEKLFQSVADKLCNSDTKKLDTLLVVSPGESSSPIALLKQSPGQVTLKHMNEWSDRLAQLDSILNPTPMLSGLTHTKIRQFAAEAERLQVKDLRDLAKIKRHTLILCFLFQAQATTRDELVEMFLRRMKKTTNSAKERLRAIQEKHRKIEEDLIGVLGQVVSHAQEDCNDTTLGRQIREVLAAQGGLNVLDGHIEAVSAYHQDNYLPMLWRGHSKYRSVLFRLLELLGIESATRDHSLIDAWKFLLCHRRSRRSHLPAEIDLDFLSKRWQVFVRNKKGKDELDRRSLEVCLFIHIAEALQCGDLFVPGSGCYADYRTQLLSWADCQNHLNNYCQAVGLPQSSDVLVHQMKQQLDKLAHEVGESFPENSELSIDVDGIPHLKRQNSVPLPADLKAFEKAIRARMPERHLLDILRNVHHWTSFTRHFGPPSGSDSKLSDSVRRYLFTVFGYGCNLGPCQTASHAPENINRQTLGRINAQHVSPGKLEAAVADIIREYGRFELPKLWGAKNVVIADGTQMELRENNLLGERHIRYGGFGGIAYHHVSATYVAMFSKFIACGVWEAVYILDALMENQSDLQPDTVHADTQGQSEPVFGLAHLLGIKLFPRMRNWREVIFYRPEKGTIYPHIDTLFSKSIDWTIIETHWQDMMQVVLSIQAGKILPSTLLRKLGSHGRQNKLNKAFRELGRVVRTLFLLRYISEADFRQSIRAETIKVESYNDFLDWIGFGGPVMKSGDPEEQVKQVKYMDLVANTVMLHNVGDLTNVLSEMTAEGWPVTKELVARISPYMRDHLRRFGKLVLDMDMIPPPLVPKAIGIRL